MITIISNYHFFQKKIHLPIIVVKKVKINTKLNFSLNFVNKLSKIKAKVRKVSKKLEKNNS